MGDREQKRANPAEDLERYIEETKREGAALRDETLQRLIFSPGGSAVMEEERREVKKEENGGFDEDLYSDALEFIREDEMRSRGSNRQADEDDVYLDARSHFDPSSVASPYSVLSPSIRGSIDPLSPNTSFAMDKMSRVSLYSPAGGPPSAYSAAPGPSSLYSPAAGPSSVYSPAAGPFSAYSAVAGPTSVYSPNGGPSSVYSPAGPSSVHSPVAGPSSAYSPTPGPSSAYSAATGPSSVYSPTNGPYSAYSPVAGPSSAYSATPGPSSVYSPAAGPSSVYSQGPSSVYSPTASSVYYPQNGQGPSSHPPSMPSPSNLPPLQSPRPPSHRPLPPPSLPPPKHSHQSRKTPKGSYHPNGVASPYGPHMVPSPYISNSVPLPPSQPGPSNGRASTSSVNPLFSPYPPNPSSHPPYAIHPHAPPYPCIQYPPSVPRIHILQAPSTQEEMARQLARQSEITARMLSQCAPQMQSPAPSPHHLQPPPRGKRAPSPNKPSTSRQSRPSKTRSQPSPNPTPSSSSSSLPVAPPSQPQDPISDNWGRPKKMVNITHLPLGIQYKFMRDYDLMMAKLRAEAAGEVFKIPKALKKRLGLPPPDADLLPVHLQNLKPISKMSEAEMDAANALIEKEKTKLAMIITHGNYKEDAFGKILPADENTLYYGGDHRYPIPKGKGLAFYIKPYNEPPKRLSPCPSPTQKPLEYVEEVPACTEGKKKPMLSRGHDDTRERRRNRNDWGEAYLKKIQSLFHSLTGDPGRVPNASTKGDKWECPFKEGEEPMGLEVYRNVRGRVWNAEFDYSPIFRQIKDITDKVNGQFTYESSRDEDYYPGERGRRNNLTQADEVPERGFVIASYADSVASLDSELSDVDDGRIAVGGTNLQMEEERRERERKEDEEKKMKSEEEEKDKENIKRSLWNPKKKIFPAYFPTLMDNRHWAKINCYVKAYAIGSTFYCKWDMPLVYIDTHEKSEDPPPNRWCIGKIPRLTSITTDPKVEKLLNPSSSSISTAYLKSAPGGYLILGCKAESTSIFVQSPLYNAMMGEELDTIVRVTHDHEMIIFDENFFNLLIMQAHQHGAKVLADIRKLLLTRVSFTKGWGEAYPKPTILDALVWVEITLINPMRKIDTLLRQHKHY